VKNQQVKKKLVMKVRKKVRKKDIMKKKVHLVSKHQKLREKKKVDMGMEKKWNGSGALKVQLQLKPELLS